MSVRLMSPSENFLKDALRVTVVNRLYFYKKRGGGGAEVCYRLTFWEKKSAVCLPERPICDALHLSVFTIVGLCLCACTVTIAFEKIFIHHNW